MILALIFTLHNLYKLLLVVNCRFGIHVLFSLKKLNVIYVLLHTICVYIGQLGHSDFLQLLSICLTYPLIGVYFICITNAYVATYPALGHPKEIELIAPLLRNLPPSQPTRVTCSHFLFYFLLQVLFPKYF